MIFLEGESDLGCCSEVAVEDVEGVAGGGGGGSKFVCVRRFKKSVRSRGRA